MSGFGGFCDFTRRSSYNSLKAMTAALSHRGADDSGYRFIPLEGMHIGLGHQRLAIKNVSPRCEHPVESHSGEYILAFDGRIYNADALRKELQQLGLVFRSDSDAEVVANAFELWGLKANDRLLGMFSFAAYSKSNNKIYLIRDRWGVKPLYYYWKDGLFLFASELKAFHQHPGFIKAINPDSIASYFLYGCVPSPNCIFKNTYKVNPGEVIELDLKNLVLQKKSYWNVADYYHQPRLNMSEDEAALELERLLVSSIRSQMIADEPMGAFLSGGYDSSFIASILQKNTSKKIKTFCVGFDDKQINEAPHARKVAQYLGTEHISYCCRGSEVAQAVLKFADVYDEPFADSSSIPIMLVSSIIKQHTRIVFSGDGSGIFIGPNFFGPASVYQKMLFLPLALRKCLLPIMQFMISIQFMNQPYHRKRKLLISRDLLQARSIVDLVRRSTRNRFFFEHELHQLLAVNFTNQDNYFNRISLLPVPKNNYINLDRLATINYRARTSVDRMFTKMEQATIASQLEVRQPFSNHKLIEFCAQLPPKFKCNKGINKYLFKKIVHQHIPRKIIEKPKQGFSTPLYHWLRGPIKEIVECYLSTSYLNNTGIFNLQAINQIKKACLYGKSHIGQVYVNQLYQILVFQLWAHKWL